MPFDLSPHLTSYSPDTEFGDSKNYLHRLAIFLIVAECMGLPVLVWALTVLDRHHKHNGRVSVSVILLLLCGIMELLLNPFIATNLIHGDCDWNTNRACWTVLSLWYGFRHCGVYLQQMMVLESVLTLRRPRCSAHVLFLPCSITLSTTALIYFFLCEFFKSYVFLLFSLSFLLSVTVASWLVPCRTTSMKEHRPNQTTKQDWTLLVYATITVMLYLMSLSLYSVIHICNLFIMSECLLSLRVAIDPLLCVLVCRQEQTYTSSDLSTEHTVVQAEHSV